MIMIKRLIFTSLIFGVFTCLQAQDTIKKNGAFFGKNSRYLGFWHHMGIGYRDVPKTRLYQGSVRLGYGYFLNNHFSPLISGAFLYSYTIQGERTLLTHYIAFTPALRYYFATKNRLYFEASYSWVRQWDDYNFKADDTRNLQALGIGFGINFRIIKKERFSWLNRNVSFEALYQYHFPITKTYSIFFVGDNIRIGLVLYL